MVACKDKFNVADYIGKKIGKWTILEYAGLNKNRSKLVKCKCECGTESIKALSELLRKKDTVQGCKSCSGYRPSKISIKRADIKAIPVEIVRMWTGIKARCYNIKNPSYKRCGGIGVKVCDEWKDDLKAFYDWAIQAGFKSNNNMRMKRLDIAKDFDPVNCVIIKEYDPNEYIGKKYGKLTVLEYSKDYGNITNPRNSATKYMKCRCECGNIINVKIYDLVHGLITECSYCKVGRRFGITKHPLYNVHMRMKSRCYNPKDKSYHNYGGRGIIICDEWLNSYEAFYDWAMANGYNEGLSIDRIDVNGNYCPENCRFATPSQQSINRRKELSNTSGYTGVQASFVYGRFFGWMAIITINKKTIYLGKYKTQKEALEARNNYIIENNLEHPIQEYIGEIGKYTEGDCLPNYKLKMKGIYKKAYDGNKYVGIYYMKEIKKRKWRATIRIGIKTKDLGCFKTQKEALEARNKYIIDNGLDYPIQEYKGEISSVDKE